MEENELKQIVLIITCMNAFFIPFIGSSINIALPSIGTDFRLDAVVLSWIPTAFLLSSAMFLLPFGRAADIYGRKKIFTYGTIIFTLGSLLSGFATSEAMLVAFFAMQGIGASMTFGTGVAILTSVFPIHEHRRKSSEK